MTTNFNSTIPSQKTKVIINDYIKGLQYNHFWWYNFLPFLGTIVALISIWWLPIRTNRDWDAGGHVGFNHDWSKCRFSSLLYPSFF